MLWKNLLYISILLMASCLLVWQLNGRRPSFPRSETTPDAAEITAVVRKIDDEFEKQWQNRNLQVAEPADNLLVARRISLGLTGTIPSLEEIRQFEKIPAPQQIDWWTRYLLDDRRSSDYLAERLARAYVGVENGPFIVYRRRRFVSWLSEQLATQRPYNELVNELLVNNGLWTDSPSVNFYTVTIDDEAGQPDPVRLAARTTRAFLGLRIDCLQCHDDALGTMDLGEEDSIRSGLQSDFHHLAAAFYSVRQTAAGLQDTAEPLDYRFKFLDDEKESTVPFKVPFRNDLLPGEGLDRERLATWLTHRQNPAFARAIVNRIWAMMAGKALINPVDDIPLYGKLPPGLESLADDLVKNNYNLRRTIRIIAQTRAFRNGSIADFEISRDHETSWAVFPQNPLRPEQVVGSLLQATSLTTINEQSNVFERLITFGSINDFIQRYGDPGEDEFRDRNETIQQKSLMMNGEIVAERTKANDLMINAAGQIARFSESNLKAIETLYLVVLSRRPTEQEQSYLVSLMQMETDGSEDIDASRKQVLEDILWSLFNKLEFLRNH